MVKPCLWMFLGMKTVDLKIDAVYRHKIQLLKAAEGKNSKDKFGRWSEPEL